MSERTRNMAVGLTVLVALGLLGGMIVIFAGVPSLFRSGYVLPLHFPAAAGVHEGDKVFMLNMPIGTVTTISFTDGDPRKGVTFLTSIETGVKVPGDVTAAISTQGFVGGTDVSLWPGGPKRFDSKGRPLDYLPTDGSITVQGTLKVSILPDEVTNAMNSLARLADSLNDLMAPPTTSGPATSGPATTGAAETAAGPQGTLQKLNRALDGMAAVLGDVENQRNLKVSLANLAKATAAANEALDGLKAFALQGQQIANKAGGTLESLNTATTRITADADALARKLIDDADKLGGSLTTLNQALGKINSGDGTLGKLLNDPQLYNSLVDTARGVDKLVQSVDALMKDWKEHGVQMKLK